MCAQQRVDPRPQSDAAALDGEYRPELSLITSDKSPWGLELRAIWRYRDLLYFLTRRDVSIRYRQTVLGGLWAVLQPFLSMVVFSVFFGNLAGLKKETGGIPYPVFVYVGLLPWMLFSQTVARASESVVGSAALVTKVYFPRMIIPLAAAGSCLLDFALSFLVLLAMMAWYGIAPTAWCLAAPAMVAVTLCAALGVGTLIAALNVAYRDFRYVVPFLIQIWMFATPVIYPVTMLPERWRWALALNPMTGIVEGWRASLVGGAFDARVMCLSLLSAVVALAAGVWYFQRVEEHFADVI